MDATFHVLRAVSLKCEDFLVTEVAALPLSVRLVVRGGRYASGHVR